MRHALHLLKNPKLAIEPGKEPPTEFRIWPLGEIETTKGTFLFDEDAAKQVLAAWKDQGNELGGDYEHASLEDPVPAAGAPSPMWFGLELRADGLYAVNVTWTPRAAEYLKNGEYRYFSPAFRVDPDSNRITKLLNIALTNIPATKNMEPLVAANDRRTKTVVASMAFDQIRDVLELALRGLYPDGYPYICDVFDDVVVFRFGSRLLQARYLIDGSTAVLEDPIEVQRTYTPVANGGTGDQPMKTLLKNLGLAETATEADALVALTSLHKQREDEGSKLMQLTGAKTRDEAIGTIAAWKAGAEQVQTLSARVQELESAANVREVEQLVAQGVADGKIPPAMKEFWLGEGKTSVATLKAYLEKAPKLVTTTDDKKTAPKTEGDLTKVVALSDEERKMAKTLGITEDAMLEQKKAAAGE